MRLYTFARHLELPLDRDRVFAFFASAENLAKITPPELGFVITTPLPIVMREGTLIDYRIKVWGVPLSWRTRITSWDPPAEFADEQLVGPYRRWIHTHRFREVPGGTAMDDEVRYALPFGLLGAVGLPLVRRQLRHIFDYRERRVRELLLSAPPAPARDR